MRRRIISILIIVLAIIALGTVFLFGIWRDDLTPNPADTIGESEKLIGNPEKAKVVVFEYADYGCSHCAEWNNTINGLVEKYGDDIAIVYRGDNLGFKNGTMAARAATAADFQGYWKKYKDLLFKNQAEWFYSTAGDAEDLFVEYFKTASDNKGDIDKFKDDMKGDAVTAQLAYESEMCDQANVKVTPTFRINGKKIALKDVVSTVEELMAKP